MGDLLCGRLSYSRIEIHIFLFAGHYWLGSNNYLANPPVLCIE